MTTLNRGAYSEACHFPAEQLHYAAGGHPGCGGYCEAVRLQAGTRTVLLLHEFRSDCDGNRHRWIEAESEDQLEELWSRFWLLINSNTETRWSDWSQHPWWTQFINCPKCYGDGTFQPTGHEEIYRCPECNGNGTIPAQVKEG